MSIKDDVTEMRKELEDVKQDNFALSILSDYKRQNKRLFIIWIITFLALIGVTCYTIYLLNDIGIIETTQTIDDIDTIENSNINNNGDIYGEDSPKN